MHGKLLITDDINANFVTISGSGIAVKDDLSRLLCLASNIRSPLSTMKLQLSLLLADLTS